MEDIEKYIIKMADIMNARFKKMMQEEKQETEEGHIYIIIDEYAKIGGKNGEASKQAIKALANIAFMGRAAHIHIIACTQRATREVLDGLIADNIPATLALRTKNAQGSRNLLDEAGCENLPMNGQGYYDSPSYRNKQLVDIPMIPDLLFSQVLTLWNEQKITLMG